MPYRVSAEEHNRWSWDPERQLYWHKPCDKMSDVTTRTCEACGAQSPDCFSWKQVEQYVKSLGQLAPEAIVKITEIRPLETKAEWNKSQVFAAGVQFVAAHWVEGSNGGYYLHITQLLKDDGDGGRQRLRFLGRYWEQETVEAATIQVQRFINLTM